MVTRPGDGVFGGERGRGDLQLASSDQTSLSAASLPHSLSGLQLLPGKVRRVLNVSKAGGEWKEMQILESFLISYMFITRLRF